MLATEHANTAIQNVRALDYLTAITGNYDTPGGQRASTRAPIEGGQMGFANNGSGMPMLSPGQMEKILGRDEIRCCIGGAVWADAAATWNAVLTGEPYPVVGAFNSSGNFMNQCNTTTTWEALKKLDFLCGMQPVAHSWRWFVRHRFACRSFLGVVQSAFIPGRFGRYGRDGQMHRPAW